MSGPLDGVRILDLSRLLPGPACTWYLQGLGATVDRVEKPGAGDFTRHMPPFVDGVGAYYAAVGHGKRSVAIELRAPGAAALIRAMLPRYDVVVEGFAPGVMEAMGLDPAALVAAQPGLVVARLSGYGQTGPLAPHPGHDINYLGLTGILAGAALVDGAPTVPPVQVADLAGALVAAMGIAAALYERERGGAGRVLDVSLTEAALSMFAPHVTGLSAEGREAAPGGEPLTGGLPIYGTYRCADGRFLTVGALEPKFQAALAAGTGALARPELAAAFATRPRDAWVDALTAACTGPVLGIGELPDHPQHAARGALYRAGRATFVRPPLGDVPAAGLPTVGEHTEIVLGECGLADRLAALRRDGVIA